MKDIKIVDEPDVVNLQIHIKKILATQNTALDSRIDRTKLGYAKTQITEHAEGTSEPNPQDEQTKQPIVKRKRGSRRTDTQSLLCHCFPKTGEGENIHAWSEMGGTWGHLKRALHKASEAIAIAEYKKPSLGLIRFEPELIDLGVANGGITYTEVNEPRSRGKTRELTLYETLGDRTINVKLLISKTCPLTGDEIGALLAALRDLDGFGPSSRGIIDKITIA